MRIKSVLTIAVATSTALSLAACNRSSPSAVVTTTWETYSAQCGSRAVAPAPLTRMTR